MRKERKADVTILTVATVLLAIGVIMVYSASSIAAEQDYGDSFYFLKRQIAWSVIGLVAMMVCSRVDYWLLHRYSRPILMVAVALLGLVLIPGIGHVSHGARRWIGFGGLAFQPSELIKLAFTVFLASYLSERPERATRIRGLIVPGFLLVMCFGLILMQPDLGTAIALAGTCAVVLFAAGIPVAHLAGMGIASVPAVALMIFGEEYRRRRFLAFLNPYADPSGSGYHIIQAIHALGSGGPFGVGLGNSRQKFFYVPEGHTDFIFAILGEELGLVGGMLVLGLFFLFAWRGYRIAMSAPDLFGTLLAAGITTMVILQVIVNVGVVTAILPITGIPLPFISFGGSSLVLTLVGVGLLLNVSKYCR